MKYDVVSLGPARMDVFVRLPDDEVVEVCSMDKKRCMIELGFGDKIPVQAMQFEVGGNTGNNAVGLSRLGHKAAMVGTMGAEWMDKRALEILQKEGVNTENITLIPDKFSFGVVINYQDERTILSYYADEECEFKLMDKELSADWVYLTTAGQKYEKFYEEAIVWAKSIGAKIAFNPGSRQIKDGLDKIRYVLAVSEVMFVNREEATTLLGGNFNDQEPISNVKDLLKGLRDLGPRIVVITDGQAGSYTYDGQKYLFMPIVEAKVVERTGAGDAFGSGFMAAVMLGKPVEECLLWGTCNSASVLGYIGPQAGLLNQTQMQEWLEKNLGVRPTEV